jgi:CBS domain-containing protein
MARTVAEVMNRHPICVSADSPVSEAARRMADADVGAVLVVHADQVVGICTDRDITVRVTAANRGPDTTVREACTHREVVAISASMSINDAAAVMREQAVHRLPVIEQGLLVGMVSLGDLTIETTRPQ